MESKDRKRVTDRWIDTALKQYGNAEPRPGLEGRVLAGLRGQQEETSEKLRWWAALGVVTAVVVVGAAIFLTRGHGVGPETPIGSASLPATKKEAKASPAIVAVAVIPLTDSSRRLIRPARPRTARSTAAAGDVEPRLEQFPSPQPLTEQEKMLAHYAQARPEEAGLLARAQAELLRQDLLEFDKQHQVPEPRPDSAQ